jgi:lipopolysaccharide assembly outer membrane protein LptD (OstA)
LGEKVKKTEEDIFYFHKGDFTTCNHKKPHFSIRSKKIKVIPGEKIITGPAHLRLFNFPTPLALPFGFFPNNQKNWLLGSNYS